MSDYDWPADNYAIGSYIQKTIADTYLTKLQINPTNKVLDIGCGNGAYSQNILAKVPKGSVLGIDPSENMLKLAQELSKKHPNFSVQKNDVLSMEFAEGFDYVVSFWCLQWIQNIQQAFENIIKSLKPGGKFFTIFPAGDDPYIMSYYALRESGQFSLLKDFKPPVDYSHFTNLAQKLAPIPCKQLKVELCKQTIILPSLDVFRKFVNGIAFYQGQIEASQIKAINEAMVQYYDNECKNKYQGEYQFNSTIYLVSGEK